MSEIEQSFKKGLHQFKRQIFLAQKNKRFEQVFSIYKETSKKAAYFLQLIKHQSGDNKLEKTVQQYIILLKAILDCTSYESSGHTLSLFKYLMNNFQKRYKNKKEIKYYDGGEHLKLSQQNIYYNDVRLTDIALRQRRYLNSQSINSQIVDITKNQIKLPNFQCVCCSQIFIHNFSITNQNMKHKVLIGLSELESQYTILQRYVCAVCNAGGGVIIIGAEKKGKNILADGISFQSLHQLQIRQNQIIRVMTSIKPFFQFEIKRVLVQANFVTKNNIWSQKDRYCFRITIMPYMKRKYYIEILNKGYHSLYETYQLSKDLKCYKVQSLENKQQNILSPYSLVHQCFYSKQNQQKSIHYKIKCCEPEMIYSKLFQTFIRQIDSKVEKGNDQQNQYDQIQIYEDQPNLKYKNTSLIVVGSKNKDRHVNELDLYMKTKKMLFLLQKPFQNTFKGGKRSIWMLSHHDKYQMIKNSIKQSDYSGSITMIPVYKSMQIDTDKLSDECLCKIEQILYERYAQEFTLYQTEGQNQFGSTKSVTILSFNCLSHAIFTYLLFQQFMLRPLFVIENTTYKKKQKYNEIKKK